MEIGFDAIAKFVISRCSKCGSRNIVVTDMSEFGDFYDIDYKCLDCGHSGQRRIDKKLVNRFL